MIETQSMTPQDYRAERQTDIRQVVGSWLLALAVIGLLALSGADTAWLFGDQPEQKTAISLEVPAR